MTAAEFLRKRAIIEHASGATRKHAWRVKALAKLVREARAVVVVSAHRVIGYQLPNGQVACLKHRFKNDIDANDSLAQIQAELDGRDMKPQRAYPCPHCHGWHLTSRA